MKGCTVNVKLDQTFVFCRWSSFGLAWPQLRAFVETVCTVSRVATHLYCLSWCVHLPFSGIANLIPSLVFLFTWCCVPILIIATGQIVVVLLVCLLQHNSWFVYFSIILFCVYWCGSHWMEWTIPSLALEKWIILPNFYLFIFYLYFHLFVYRVW